MNWLAFPSVWLVCREEQDCEYARVIQEELLQCDEEAKRREEEDEVLFVMAVCVCMGKKTNQRMQFYKSLSTHSTHCPTVYSLSH